MNKKLWALFCHCVIFVLLVTVVGCSIGKIQANGNKVYVNERLMANAEETYLYNQDKITTGENSSAIINFKGYGYMLLDEDTDPKIGIFDDILRIVMRWGQIFFHKDNGAERKAEIDTPGGSSILNSKVNIKVLKDQQITIITVGEGEVVFTGKDKSEIVKINEFQQITVDKGIPGKLEKIEKSKYFEIIEWTKEPCKHKPNGKSITPVIQNTGDGKIKQTDVIKFSVPLFAFDQYSLSIDEANKIKEVVNKCLETESGCSIYVNGYTDSIGSRSYNKRLSERRAETVRLAISKQCNEQKCRIIPKGFGEDNPCKSNSTNDGRQINRRVEICAIPGGSQQSKENLCEQERNKICDYKSQQ